MARRALRVFFSLKFLKADFGLVFFEHGSIPH
jgi:hypothetical protein